MCLKFLTEVTLHVSDTKPQVSSIGIYDPFPKVTCYRTVQNNEVVRNTGSSSEYDIQTTEIKVRALSGTSLGIPFGPL